MTTNSQITIGIDEVGRGPLAGPLVVSAVALDMNRQYQGLVDSKTLTSLSRHKLSTYIKQQALGIGIGWVNANDIDNLGITMALKLATKRAFQQLPDWVRRQTEQIIIDGTMDMLGDPRVLTLVKADSKVQAVSAASIIAKVARDDYMVRIGELYPQYGFANHVGYGTAKHMEAIEHLGIIKGMHRLICAPIERIAGVKLPKPPKRSIDSTIGRIAEHEAADYLIKMGYRIIECNWKIKICEIDIIAQKDDSIFFVEVKYRKNNQHGDGVAAITPKKLEQMHLAARSYLYYSSARFDKLNPRLAVVSLHDNPPVVDDFIILD